MKIIVYTVTDCQFSKQEKEYLTAKNLPFEERNLEVNKEWLTEMLEVGNNFAGTPVTKVEKDSGEAVVLKGFTKEEFDQALGFAPAPEATAAPVEGTVPAVQTPAPAPTSETPPAPAVAEVPTTPVVPAVDPAVPVDPQQVVNAAVADVQPAAVAPQPVVEPAVPPAPTAPDVTVVPPVAAPAQPDANPQLNSLLQNLQAKATDPVQTPAVPTAPAPQAPAQAGTPQIPDFH